MRRVNYATSWSWFLSGGKEQEKTNSATILPKNCSKGSPTICRSMRTLIILRGGDSYDWAILLISDSRVLLPKVTSNGPCEGVGINVGLELVLYNAHAKVVE